MGGITCLEEIDNMKIQVSLGVADWIGNPNGTLEACNVSGDKAKKLINILNICNFKQHSAILNCDLKILDLVLATDDLIIPSVNRNSSNLVSVDLYHPPTEFTVNLRINYLTESDHRNYNFRKANYEQVIGAIEGINWNFIHLLSAEQALSQFYELINSIIKAFVPQYKAKKKHPSWYDLDLIKLLKKKENSRRKWKKFLLNENYAKYSQLRSQCKTKIRECYKQYIRFLQDNIKNNIKLFWSYSKSKRKMNSYPTTIQYNNNSASTPQDISEVFSSYFQSTFTSHSPNFPNFSTLNDVRPNIVRPTITKECVEDRLFKLIENKNGGPDGIPAYFWKKVGSVIAHPLSLIFNKSLDEGTFPDAFKRGFVTPIFKSGDKSIVTNYRPVCLLNILALVFEKCVLNSLLPQVLHLISVHQHGFMPGRSTNSNIIKFVDFILNALDDRGEVHCIYTDFSKAFDTVNHRILIEN